MPKKNNRSFIVEVHLSTDVNGDLLQKAVDKTLVRLPYYRQTIVRKGSLFYYAENDLPFEVGEHDGPRPVDSAEVNYHMIDIAYEGELDLLHDGACALRWPWPRRKDAIACPSTDHPK